MVFLGWDEFAQKVEDLIHNGIRLIDEGLNNALGITLVEMLIQLCATLILFLIVRFFVWNKLTAILDKRKQSISDAIKQKDEAILESNRINAETEKQVNDAKIEAQKIIEKAKSKGYEQAEEIVRQAEETAKLKVQNAESEIEMKVAESQNEIKKEIVDVAYEMASNIVGKEIEKGSYQLDVNDYLNKVKANDEKH